MHDREDKAQKSQSPVSHCKNRQQGLDSAVKSIHSSKKGPKFSSQRPKLTTTHRQVCGAYTYMKTNTHIQNKPKNRAESSEGEIDRHKRRHHQSIAMLPLRSLRQEDHRDCQGWAVATKQV